MDSTFPKTLHIVFPDNDHADIIQLNETRWACPICGYPLDEEPYGPTGAGAYNICDSCGVEFGYDDYFFGKPLRNGLRPHVQGWKELRDKWLMKTKITDEIRAQLANIGVSV